VDIFAIDAETVKTASLVVIGGSFIALLLVLKFVKSVITKLLLIIVFIAIGLLSFGQHDALTACVNKVKAQAQAAIAIDTTCEFFGRKVTISLPTGS